MPLKVLIIGAGVCGPAFATLLRRADPSSTIYDITIIERAAKLRDTGHQVDLRSQGIPIVRKMGLLDAIRRRAVPEKGVCFVDGTGRTFARFGMNDSGHGAQAMTSEYEIMRGDLVDVFYKASLGLDPDVGDGGEDKAPDCPNVRYEFGVTVTSLTQHDDAGVDVTFSDGRSARYDLVVGADGQSSRTRRMILGQEASDACFRPLGLYTALYMVPRGPEDDGWMRCHLMPGRRGIFTRSADEKAPTQVYLSVQTKREENAYGVPAAMSMSTTATATAAAVVQQKEAFAAAFADQHGWRVDELVRGALVNQTPEDNFYATEVGQVRCKTLVSGRVALLGDAGYCPSPITGMGTTLSFTGAYLLAGELARHGNTPDAVPAALEAYASAVRPFVDEAQRLAPGFPRALYAESRWGVWLLTTFVSLLARSRLVDLLVRILPENVTGLRIPKYPELNLDE